MACSSNLSRRPALTIWNHYEFALTPAAFGVTQQAFDIIKVWKSMALSNDWQSVGPLVTGDDTVKVYSHPAEEPRSFFRVDVAVP